MAPAARSSRSVRATYLPICNDLQPGSYSLLGNKMMNCSADLLTDSHLRVKLQSEFITEEDEMQAYCMKCREKVEIKNPKAITMKNGRPATQGECPGCGTRVYRIGKS